MTRARFVCFAAIALSSACGARPHAAAAEVARYMTESADVERYFAYANAALGRPYFPMYVRTADEWRRFFDTGARQRRLDLADVTPSKPLVPYRDFLVEYPPGFFLVAVPPALVARSERAYAVAFGLFMLALLSVAVLMTARATQPGANGAALASLAGWTLVAAIALGTVVTQRYDASVAMLTAVMCWAAIARRPVALGIAAGAAIAVKIVPLLAAAMCVLYLVTRGRRRELALASASAAVTAAAIGVPFFVAAGAAVFDVVRYQFDRPLEIFSTPAAVLGLWHLAVPASVSVTYSFGSTNVAGPLAAASEAAFTIISGLTLAGVFAIYGRRLRQTTSDADRARLLVAGTAVVFAAFIATAKVGSPQYLVWLLPLGMATTLADRRPLLLALFLMTLLLAQIGYAVVLSEVETLRPWASGLVLARNVALMTWAAMIAVRTPTGLEADA